MKLAIMQPYIFPYIGYFQLIAAVDKFVFYDDVNFIKKGWINRNRLLINGEVRYITIPLSGASQFTKINKIEIQPSEYWKNNILKSIYQSYSKAPYFKDTYNLISEIILSNEKKISNLAQASVAAISNYLGLRAGFVVSSMTYENTKLAGETRVIDICTKENADQYYNLPGGAKIYDRKLFSLNGIELYFIEPELKSYHQFSRNFHPGLSIIDVLMFNDKISALEMILTKS